MRTPCLVLVLSALCAGCSVDCEATGPMSGEAGPLTTRERSVEEFTQVQSLGSIDVHITQGTETRVEVEAPEDEIDEIETLVEDGILSIRKRSALSLRWSGGRTVVRVTTPSLRAVRASGSGDVDIQGLDTETFELETMGSGDTRIAGEVDVLELESTGSGDTEAAELRARIVTLSMTGSGDVSLHATERVSGTATGSGDLDVAGSPTCRIDRTGSGDVSC